MSQEIKAFKEHIKHTKAQLKKLNEENATQPNKARDALIGIYSRDLAEHEVALRGLKIRGRVEKAGLDYDEWWAWAQSLYSIDYCVNSNQFVVTSKARTWETDMSWGFADQISCKEKVEQLVGYKIRDRKRGRGDMEKDLADVASSN